MKCEGQKVESIYQKNTNCPKFDLSATFYRKNPVIPITVEVCTSSQSVTYAKLVTYIKSVSHWNLCTSSQPVTRFKYKLICFKKWLIFFFPTTFIKTPEMQNVHCNYHHPVLSPQGKVGYMLLPSETYFCQSFPFTNIIITHFHISLRFHATL